MNEEFVIGLDLGTSGCRAAAVTSDGRIIGIAEHLIATSSPVAGWAEQSPADWLAAALSSLRTLLAGLSPDRVHALALTSAAHIGVLLDIDGAPVRPAITWQDQRSTLEVAELTHEFGAVILRQTFQAVTTGWTLPHIAWVRRNEPETWARVARIELSKDWLYRNYSGLSTI